MQHIKAVKLLLERKRSTGIWPNYRTIVEESPGWRWKSWRSIPQTFLEDFRVKSMPPPKSSKSLSPLHHSRIWNCPWSKHCSMVLLSVPYFISSLLTKRCDHDRSLGFRPPLPHRSTPKAQKSPNCTIMVPTFEEGVRNARQVISPHHSMPPPS